MEEPRDIILFFGRFHPLVVHLPIGFLIIAIVFEFLSRTGRVSISDKIIRLTWLLGAVGAALSAALGYMLSFGGDYNQETLNWHMWSGITLTIVSFGCFFLKDISAARWVYLSLVVSTALLVTITGHHGGSLTHGSDYLVEHAPVWIQKVAGRPPEFYEKRLPVTSLDSADIFLDAIMPTMRAKCTSCHNNDKRKGKLLLTNYESMLLGGEEGPAIVPGNPDSSIVYQRITLPSDHDDFMPAEGKRPLTEDQVAIIGWWISKRAPQRATISSLSPDDQTTELFNRYFGLGSKSLDLIEVPQADEDAIAGLRQQGFLVHTLSAKTNLVEVVLPEGTTSKPDISLLSTVKDQIAWLQLGHGNISNADLSVIGGLSNLRILNISRNPISDEGVKQLATLEHLEYLNLYETRISDNGVRELLKLPSLNALYVWQTKVTAPVMDSIMSARPGLKIVYLNPVE